MRPSKLLLVDALINLILGAFLATFPSAVVDFVGVPGCESKFYPSILGAVLIGIGLALVVEFFRKPRAPAGLGLLGAISINLCGACFLVGWLLSGRLDVPARGQVFLWGLAILLAALSVTELVRSRVVAS